MHVSATVPIHPILHSSTTVSTCPFSTSVSLFLVLVHLYLFSGSHIYTLIYSICSSLPDSLHSVWQTLGPSMSKHKWPYFVPLYGWVIFHCVYVPHILYPVFHWQTFRLLPCPGKSLSLVHISLTTSVLSSTSAIMTAAPITITHVDILAAHIY